MLCMPPVLAALSEEHRKISHCADSGLAASADGATASVEPAASYQRQDGARSQVVHKIGVS